MDKIFRFANKILEAEGKGFKNFLYRMKDTGGASITLAFQAVFHISSILQILYKEVWKFK